MPLFLGGFAHGQRLNVPEGMREVVLPIPTPPMLASPSMADALPPVMDYPLGLYVAKVIRFPGVQRDVRVFVPQGTTAEWSDRALADYLDFG
jgi:hypothetical protein